MELGSLLVLLLLLACPLMMVWMMRGHGSHGGHASHGAHSHVHDADKSSQAEALDDLLRRRNELDAKIAELDRVETETKTPVSA